MRLNRSDYRTVQPLGIEVSHSQFRSCTAVGGSVPSGRTPLAARSAGHVALSESQSDGQYTAQRGCEYRGGPLPRPQEPRERHGARQGSVLERVARPPPAPSLNRLLGEGLAGRFKRSRSLCGRSHRSGRRNRPQRWSSSRLCRVHPALDRVGAREGQLPLPNTPSGTDDAGGRRRAAPAGRPPARPLLLSRAVAASLCASPARPPRPNGLGALGACVSIPSGRRLGTERTPARGTAR